MVTASWVRYRVRSCTHTCSRNVVHTSCQGARDESTCQRDQLCRSQSFVSLVASTEAFAMGDEGESTGSICVHTCALRWLSLLLSSLRMKSFEVLLAHHPIAPSSKTRLQPMSLLPAPTFHLQTQSTKMLAALVVLLADCPSANTLLYLDELPNSGAELGLLSLPALHQNLLHM